MAVKHSLLKTFGCKDVRLYRICLQCFFHRKEGASVHFFPVTAGTAVMLYSRALAIIEQ